jgi:phosphopantothenoylcysteine decarboxylase/phosphopantothenate--cysteine ligase
MSRAAGEFITPLTLQAVSGRTVRDQLWDSAAEAGMGHIELARWPDVILVAPATAHFLARLSHGLADDLLTTLCLAGDKPLYVAPAMNHLMWSNCATSANLALLVKRGVKILGPAEGDQACGETGPGRMLEPGELLTALAGHFAGEKPGPLAGTRVLMTAGPTREALDPVRYLTNRSSGKMGFAVAEAAVRAGARVTLVTGPVTLATPEQVDRIDVESAMQMHREVMSRVSTTDIFIASAAVADYRPETAGERKIKKTHDEMALTLVRNPDILATVAALARAPFTVGFAAETHDVLEYAQAKRVNKDLDMIAANRVGPGMGFESEENALEIIWEGGGRSLAQAPKPALASQLVALIAERYLAHG